MRKKRVLFVGSFPEKSKSGHVGGQMFACSSLVSSNLSERIDFVTIDTTASTNKDRGLFERLIGAAIRLIKFCFHLLFSRIDSVLVFCSNGYSFKEKGLMIIFAKKLNKQTILAPRTGHLINDITKSLSFKNNAQKVFNHADTIICQGSFWKGFFKENFDNVQNKLEVIHNWIDFKKIERNNFSDVNEQLQILFLGWVDRNKGIFELISAAEKLRELDIKWVVGGNGRDFEEAKILVESNGLQEKISLLGWVHNEAKEDLLLNSDVFLLPSYAEGLPNAMLESMMYGLPAIVSDVGAVSDIIEHENNGYLINPKNSEDIKDIVMSIYENRSILKTLSKNAQQTIAQKNALTVGINKMEKVLNK